MRLLKELERENSQPKKLVAERALDIAKLKEVAKGNFQARRAGGVRTSLPRAALRSTLVAMRLSVLILASLGVLMGSTARARGDDAPSDLRIEAKETGEGATATVTIAPDGGVHATWQRVAGKQPEVVDFVIGPDEMARARGAVIAAQFFKSWSPGPFVFDGSTWSIWVRLGSQEQRRTSIRYPQEFEPLRVYLDRFMRQASITAALRRGDFDAGGSGQFTDLPHLASVVGELIACAARQTKPARCARAADMLLDVAGPENWLRPAQDLLARLDGDCRAAVLVAWTDRLRRPDGARLRTAFAPTLLEEAEASAPRWATLTEQQKWAVEGVLGRLLMDGEPRAFDIAEQMARTFGEPGKPFVPPWLVETGEAAVPLVVRLMDSAQPQARANAVHAAGVQIGVLRVHVGLRERLTDAARSALELRVGEEVVPALERRLRDPAESYAVRRSCVTYLDWWDRRCEAAGKRHIEKEREENKEKLRRERAEWVARTSPQPARGKLVIAGRLLGPFDLPLPGFGVIAVRRNGGAAESATTAEDGSFRIEGLAAGESYDLVEADLDHLPMPYLPAAARAAEGVAAGSEEVVLRLPGSLIRGRMLRTDGTPVADYPVWAQPRSSPTEWPFAAGHRAKTDASGRFWFVRLPSGAYDLMARDHGRTSLRGGLGVEGGPDERVIRVLDGEPIAGRLVDETGAPLAGASVDLVGVDPTWSVYRTVMSTADGSFRFEWADTERDHCIRVVGPARDGTARGAILEGVHGGTQDLVLRVGTANRLRFRIAYGDRGSCEPEVRVIRITGGPVLRQRFSESPVDWLAAPRGTWRVLVRALDLDAQGFPQCSWVEVGTAVTGESEKTLTVPP